jgi:hypothetical protein
LNSRKSLYDIASFYNKNSVHKASFRGMRYQVEKMEIKKDGALEDEKPEKRLKLTIWPEPFSYENTPDEKKTTVTFEYTEEGLDEAYEKLVSFYDEHKDEFEKIYEDPFGGIDFASYRSDEL